MLFIIISVTISPGPHRTDLGQHSLENMTEVWHCMYVCMIVFYSMYMCVCSYVICGVANVDIIMFEL